MDSPLIPFGVERLDSALTPGTVVGDKYRVERVIGLGGMGTVYLATHIELDASVALKVLASHVTNNAEAVSRFFREARAAARITGEHVARVLDVGRIDGETPFMVMEYLEGCDLGTLLETEGPQPVDVAIEYILQAADAVAQAHALGIIHRDLKPRNLFLTKRSDDTPLIKVLDFGISKADGLGVDAYETTHDGAFLGSPSYMAPEQIQNAKTVSAQADVWSLGVILYELLTGHTPFEADSMPGVLVAISIAAPTSILAHRDDLPPHVVTTIERCLEKLPDARPADVGELVSLLTSGGRASLRTRAGRVGTTLHRVAEHHAASPRRVRVSDPPRRSVSVTGVSASVPVPVKRRPWDRGARWTIPAPRRVAAGALAGLFVGAMSVLGLTRSAASPDVAPRLSTPASRSTIAAELPVLLSAEPPPTEMAATEDARDAGAPTATVFASKGARSRGAGAPVLPRVTDVSGAARTFGERAGVAAAPRKTGSAEVSSLSKKDLSIR